MTALSGRLTKIAAQFEKGETMADIGTDHGFLPLYLWENSVCPKVIMTDISSGSLDKAKEAFQRTIRTAGGKEPDIHFRLGDGLEPLEKGEVDTVVIAGMGGVLMTYILGHDVMKTLSLRNYILQPRNGSGKLRYWLDTAGFEIVSEALAPEGKFICEILTVKPPARISTFPSLNEYPDRIEYEMPRGLTREDENLFKLYINKKLNIEKVILNAMIDGKSCDMEKKNRTEDRIRFLEGKHGF